MELPEELPIARVFENAASLLNNISKDGHSVQCQLADLIDTTCYTCLSQSSLMTLQLLDRITQTLEDLATVFQISAETANNDILPNWKIIANQVKLENVRLMLSFGSGPASSESFIEFF